MMAEKLWSQMFAFHICYPKRGFSFKMFLQIYDGSYDLLAKRYGKCVGLADYQRNTCGEVAQQIAWKITITKINVETDWIAFLSEFEFDLSIQCATRRFVPPHFRFNEARNIQPYASTGNDTCGKRECVCWRKLWHQDQTHCAVVTIEPKPEFSFPYNVLPQKWSHPHCVIFISRKSSTRIHIWQFDTHNPC